MARIFLIFTGAFIVCFFTGFYAERVSLRKPDSLKLAIAQEIKIAPYNGRYVFSYPDREGNHRLIYDSERNKVILLDPSLFVRDRSQMGVAESTFKYLSGLHPAISGAFGGVTLGFTAKELISSPALVSRLGRLSRSKEVVAAIAGSMSGLLFGIGAARAVSLPDISTSEGIALLQDTKFWQNEPLLLFGSVALRSMKIIENIDDIQRRQVAESRLKDIVRRVATAMQEEGRLTSQNLEMFAKETADFELEFAEAAKRERDFKDFLSNLIWGSISFVGFVWVCILLFVVGTALHERFKARANLAKATGG